MTVDECCQERQGKRQRHGICGGQGLCTAFPLYRTQRAPQRGQLPVSRTSIPLKEWMRPARRASSPLGRLVDRALIPADWATCHQPASWHPPTLDSAQPISQAYCTSPPNKVKRRLCPETALLETVRYARVRECAYHHHTNKCTTSSPSWPVFISPVDRTHDLLTARHCAATQASPGSPSVWMTSLAR